MNSDPAADEPYRRSIGRRDLTEWRSHGGRRLVAAQRRLAQRQGERTALVATLAVGAAVAVAGTWATTFLYDAVTDRDGISRLDVPMLHRAMRARNAVTTGTSAAIAHGFGPVGMPLLAVASGAALALRRRDPAPLAVVVATGLGSLLMTIGGKDVVERHRPARHDAVAPFEHSPSFPSGHTLNATAVTGALAYLLMLEQRSVPAQIGTAVAAAATAGTVGMSRVLLGAHWFTDVLTGWAAGTGWLALVVTADRLRLTVDRRDAPRTPAAHEPAGTA